MGESIVLFKQPTMKGSYEKYKDEAAQRLLEGLVDLGVPITIEQQQAFEVLLRSELDKAKVYSNLGGHRGSTSKYRLVVKENTIVGYHPVKIGDVTQWVHITQVITPEGKTRYWTNGVEQKVE